ncbi:DUF2550 domain-containing protein [Actinoplanes sp. NPDC051859]|uniref:DUF2550 domain-containing protein n=1 Tax=Actinoplanes sp. NPDC051859 TaxID=3363909 RepID=UPI003791AE62
MRVLLTVGICVAALLVLLSAVFIRRRLIMGGGGTIRLQVRVSTMVPGRGWSSGVGQFVGDELRFHRFFSLAFRPKRVLNRRAMTVHSRRSPEGPERMTMGDRWVVLVCRQAGIDLEIAMAGSTVTGFLSWLEAGPPGQPGSVAPRPASTPRPAE